MGWDCLSLSFKDAYSIKCVEEVWSVRRSHPQDAGDGVCVSGCLCVYLCVCVSMCVGGQVEERKALNFEQHYMG